MAIGKPSTFKVILDHWGKAVSAILATIALVGMLNGWFDGYVAEITKKNYTIEITDMELRVDDFENRLDMIEILSKKVDTLADESRENAKAMRVMSEAILGLQQEQKAFREEKKLEKEPVMKFSNIGNTISDGQPGGLFEFQWSYFRLRDECGRPRVDLYFRNGGDLTHRFDPPSLVDANGLGLQSQANPLVAQTIKYAARMPSNVGVHEGTGRGWAEVSYPKCPFVEPVTSPEIVFQIFPQEE